MVSRLGDVHFLISLNRNDEDLAPLHLVVLEADPVPLTYSAGSADSVADVSLIPL